MYAVIIGGQRCATTWLIKALGQHPAVVEANPKEEPSWARVPGGMPRVADVRGGLILQKATRWLTTPGTARRLKERIPDAKVIMIGRDMVDRAWSHYRYTRAEGPEDLDYRKALAVEPARLQALDPEISHWYAYAAHSAYPVHLIEGGWIELFGEGQLFLAKTEELDFAGQALLTELALWLGLDPALFGGIPGLVNEGEPMNELVTNDVMDSQDLLAWKFAPLEAEWDALWRENRNIKAPPSEDEGAETREERGSL